MARVQTNRRVGLKTPLGPDELLIRKLEAVEELGRLPVFELDLVSEDFNIDFSALLGQALSLRFDLESGDARFVHGHVHRFSYVGSVGRMANYRASVSPWLWFLTRTSDCRIFQEKTVPDILKEVFRDNGFSDFDFRLSETYRTWEYCVQYRETDFDFVSRLMEQEGIYYHFEYEEDAHKMILSDAPSAHEAFPGYERLRYYPPDEDVVRDEEHVYDWALSQQVSSGNYVLLDFDFKVPRKGMEARSAQERSHARADAELFDYPGEYVEASEGEAYVRRRLEQLQAEFEVSRGVGNARGLAVGRLFELTDHSRDDQNRKYLITGAEYTVSSDVYESGAQDATEVFEVRFKCIDATVPFRAAPITARPEIRGPQTAIVTGPSGNEIYTDEHGRVKCHFHWDRHNPRDDTSSCWIRVSQTYAGSSWGSIMIPRVDQEVIVEFLEGDPDRPIITGRVYNGESKPPYDLPDSKNISGLKSNTTPGGGGYNEISVDDTSGEEMITIHGQFDMSTVIEHDQTLTVHNNRTSTVDIDDSETVGQNQVLDVGVDQTLTVGSNQEMTVGADRTLSVGANETISVGADQGISVGGSRTASIGTNDTTEAGANLSLKAGANTVIEAGALGSYKSGGPMVIDCGAALTIKAAASITIQVGGSSISISPGSIAISTSGPVTVAGAMVKNNC